MARFCILLMLLACPWGAQAETCRKGSPEKFDTFFARFSKEAAYAKKRTIYPLSVTMIEPGTKEIKTASISRSEDEPTPALDDFMRGHDLGFSGVRLDARTATVRMFKTAPSWQLAYRFTLETGCWYLKEIEDRYE